ncbi:stage II sporulation protein D [Virgibacillus sp. 179-BFC.A HS]|uniref:Stage II sporulation protein D n=1 Tax=Tigheibacillus jepli TaxID=3035914 RepID=A0ABU5CFD5_9BACI|nr:stage II sporulation protein D [Virgibacillus sp. 179-BFC.A HS]MDY0404577.1 stage II sporulation protein D [Virgibacillus sp. 179-BFC.A HS]
MKNYQKYLRQKKKQKRARTLQQLKKHPSLPRINQAKFPRRQRPAWKAAALLIAAGLFAIILVVPTIIVVPYTNSSGSENIMKEKQMNTTKSNNDDKAELADDSGMSVPVMRHQSQQIESIPLETYVARVVANEMPAEFEMEALKAQALAARTYVVYQLANKDKENGYVTDTEQDQVYRNDLELRKIMGKDYDKKMGKIKKAVAASKGQILTYEDNPIFPAFFSTSNGYTENSEDYWGNKLPYLRSVKSPWDEKSPKFMDQKTMEVTDVGRALGVSLPANGAIPVEVSRTDGHRVKEIKMGKKTFSGKEVREKLDLRSSDFTMEQKDNYLIFTTKGFGHGIGMSQYGANGMAKEGKNYKEIVKYYYKGVKISTLQETAPKLVSR